MKEKEEKQKGNFWLTAATFIVNKRKAIEILFILAIIYSVLSINKVQVNQDITSYLPADSETRQGLSIMDEQFVMAVLRLCLPMSPIIRQTSL